MIETSKSATDLTSNLIIQKSPNKYQDGEICLDF